MNELAVDSLTAWMNPKHFGVLRHFTPELRSHRHLRTRAFRRGISERLLALSPAHKFAINRLETFTPSVARTACLHFDRSLCYFRFQLDVLPRFSFGMF